MFSGLRGVIREVPYGNDEFSSGYPCEKGDLRIHRAHLHRFCRGNRLSGGGFHGQIRSAGNTPAE